MRFLLTSRAAKIASAVLITIVWSLTNCVLKTAPEKGVSSQIASVWQRSLPEDFRGQTLSTLLWKSYAFVWGANTLFALESNTGQTSWTICSKASEFAYNATILDGKYLLLASEDGTLYKIDPRTGQQTLTSTTFLSPDLIPTKKNQPVAILVAANPAKRGDEIVVALRSPDLSEAWRYSLPHNAKFFSGEFIGKYLCLDEILSPTQSCLEVLDVHSGRLKKVVRPRSFHYCYSSYGNDAVLICDLQRNDARSDSQCTISFIDESNDQVSFDVAKGFKGNMASDSKETYAVIGESCPKLIALDVPSHKIMWQADIGCPEGDLVIAPEVLVSSSAVIVNYNDSLMIFDRATGRSMYKNEKMSTFQCSFEDENILVTESYAPNPLVTMLRLNVANNKNNR